MEVARFLVGIIENDESRTKCLFICYCICDMPRRLVGPCRVADADIERAVRFILSTVECRESIAAYIDINAAESGSGTGSGPAATATLDLDSFDAERSPIDTVLAALRAAELEPSVVLFPFQCVGDARFVGDESPNSDDDDDAGDSNEESGDDNDNIEFEGERVVAEKDHRAVSSVLKQRLVLDIVNPEGVTICAIWNVDDNNKQKAGAEAKFKYFIFSD